MKWTEKQTADAMRAALRIALAAQRYDTAAVRAEVRAAPNHGALVWSLGRLPGVMIAAVSEREGTSLDPEEVLGSLLDGFPAVIDPREN